jgi:hypothetical protein
MTSTPLTGGCGCGAIRFVVREPLALATYCHCTRCQHRTGGGSSIQARVVPGSFALTQGEEQLGVWAPPGGFEKCFCRLCGSSLFSRNPADPAVVAVRFGAIDGDPGIRPSYHQYVAYAPAWDAIPDDGLPRYPERPSA